MTQATPDDRWLYAWSAGYGAVGASSVLVPLYAIELGASPFVVGVVAATAAFAGIPGALLWGRLATRTGRRRVLVLISLAATAAVLVGLALVRSLWALLVGNAVLWFAVAAAAPVLALLVVDDHPESDWDDRIGRLNAVQGYGWLAGLLAGAGWTAVAAEFLDPATAQRSFLLVSGVVTAGSVVLTRRWLPAKPSVSAARFGRSTRAVASLLAGSGRRAVLLPLGGSRAYWALRRFRPRRLVAKRPTALGAYLLAVACCFTGFAVFFGPLPAYLRGVGYGTGAVFVLFTTSSAASAAFYVRAAGLAGRHGPQRVQVGALAARGLLFPAVALVGVGPLGLPALAVVFALVGVTWAVVAVTATGIVTRLAPPALRGNALGAYTALGGLGGGVGSLLGGWLAGVVGFAGTFAVAGTLVLLGAIVALAGFRRSSRAAAGAGSPTSGTAGADR